jgi:hypothetical protein
MFLRLDSVSVLRQNLLSWAQSIELYRIWCWYKYPEIGTSSSDWTQLSRILPEDGESIQSSTRCVQYKKNRQYSG